MPLTNQLNTHMTATATPANKAKLSRRSFLQGTGGAFFGALAVGMMARNKAHAQAVTGKEILFVSAVRQAQLIKDKQISSVELVKMHLAAIEKINPKINALVTLCSERALQEAAEADAALAKGQIKGPLHGVPFSIKDSLMCAGVVSTAGTVGYKKNIPALDATAVARVRAAGGILLGKSNTPEFTLGGGGRGTYNLLFGQTRNPYNLDHHPNGSSGGAGAAVSAGIAAFDIGSDFGGSVRSPAHACGIVGMKPTTGRIPRTGHAPGYGGAFDAYQQLGPMTRFVEDNELIYNLIAGPDDWDAIIHPVELYDPSKVNLKSLRIAYYTDNKVAPCTPETVAAIERAVKLLQGAVASVKQDYHGGDLTTADLRDQLTEADGGAWLKRMLDEAGTTEVSPGFARRLTGETISSPEFCALMEKQDEVRVEMLKWMDNYDAIICPVASGPAGKADAPVVRTTSGAVYAGYTRIYNITGWPAVVIRGGISPEGVPLGIQIAAKPWREDVCYALARFLEKPMGGYQKPALAS